MPGGGRGEAVGTGVPLSFRCSACRRKYGTDEYHGQSWSRDRGWVDRVVLTGRERRMKRGSPCPRSDDVQREYRCRDCGHVGWSRHSDLRRKAKG